MFQISVALMLLLAPCARADICDLYRNISPTLYKALCKGPRSTKHTSRTSSSFGDAFNLNPSGLPNEPSPYGLESIGHQIRGDSGRMSSTFGIIKGFNKIGAGVSTAGNNTFYGNDVIQRATGAPEVTAFDHGETARGNFPNFNFGTSIALAGKKSSVPTALGFSLRYNKITNQPGFGLGISARPSIFTLGVGAAREDISNHLDAIKFYNGSLGIRLPLIEFEYAYLYNVGGYRLRPIQIGTVTLLFGKLLPTFAIRKAEFNGYGTVAQKHWSLQYQFSQHVTAGFLYNYIPGVSSIAAQVFL